MPKIYRAETISIPHVWVFRGALAIMRCSHFLRFAVLPFFPDDGKGRVRTS